MSFTGIGRIGSQHILNVNIQNDVENFAFPLTQEYWCTHPIKYSVDINNGTDITLTAGSKIVTGTGTLFTNLCADIQMDNKPIWRYVACIAKNTGVPLILDIDYVIDDETMVLKFASPYTDDGGNSYPIDYFNTMILKDVTIMNELSDANIAVGLILGSKFGSSEINVVGSRSHNIANEGGVEPILVSASPEVAVILNY
jgi:hypothetical protein